MLNVADHLAESFRFGDEEDEAEQVKWSVQGHPENWEQKEDLLMTPFSLRLHSTGFDVCKNFELSSLTQSYQTFLDLII